MSNVNVFGGKKTRETIKTSKEDLEKKKKTCGKKVRGKDKNQHIWKIFQINLLKNKRTHKAN